MSNALLRNAVMDAFNKSEFTNIFEHERMLADKNRVNTYKKAIDKYIKPGDSVVDLGTGSGILALFAAINHPKIVYAIDHSDFIDVARVIAGQRPELPIRFEKINSRSFTPPEKLDYVLHEQIGDDLFEENMIENLLDLKKRVLKNDGKIFPGKFELYLEPFSLKENDRIPFLWENNFCDIDFGFLEESRILEKYKSCRRQNYLEPTSFDHFLCNPKPVLTFDLNEEGFEPDFEIKRQYKTVIHPGIIDGVCLYFKVIFDEQISFDTSPLSGWSSWGNRVFNTDRRDFKEAGSTIEFDLTMEDYLLPQTWKLNFQDYNKAEVAKKAAVTSVA